jgi:hypothetical protein
MPTDNFRDAKAAGRGKTSKRPMCIADSRAPAGRDNDRQGVIREIRSLVRAGIASGHVHTADEVFDRLEAKYRSMCDRRST